LQTECNRLDLPGIAMASNSGFRPIDRLAVQVPSDDYPGARRRPALVFVPSETLHHLSL
jgi:hypothetical protein